MNRFTKLTGVAAVAVSAAIAGGVGVAFGLGGGDGGPNHDAMAGTMPMDPATMDAHMRAMMGDEGFAAMQGYMLEALGEDGFAAMLTRMADGCTAQGMAMRPQDVAPADHEQHHPGPGAQ
ncbi:MAG: hypothetical protein KJ048_08130 [Dehalococcoidia bacterium]|nr:hypothetical protein [Dehalococcoidia bacterium]